MQDARIIKAKLIIHYSYILKEEGKFARRWSSLTVYVVAIEPSMRGQLKIFYWQSLKYFIDKVDFADTDIPADNSQAWPPWVVIILDC